MQWCAGVYWRVWVCTGVYVLLTSVVLVDLLSVERLSNSFGLVLLFQGIASLIGPPIAGRRGVVCTMTFDRLVLVVETGVRVCV